MNLYATFCYLISYYLLRGVGILLSFPEEDITLSIVGGGGGDEGLVFTLYPASIQKTLGPEPVAEDRSP